MSDNFPENPPQDPVANMVQHGIRYGGPLHSDPDGPSLATPVTQVQPHQIQPFIEAVIKEKETR